MVPEDSQQANCSIGVHQVLYDYYLLSHDSAHVRNLLQEVHFQPPPNWHRVPFYFIRYPGPLLCFQASRICVTARFIDSRFDFLFLRKRGKYSLPAREKEKKERKKLKARLITPRSRVRTKIISYAFLKANKKLIPSIHFTHRQNATSGVASHARQLK